MSDEIKEKIHILEQRHNFMIDTWEKRKILYDQNLDTQVLAPKKSRIGLIFNTHFITYYLVV